MAYLFISCNLAVISHPDRRSAMMERGKIVERGAGYAIMDSWENDYIRQ